MSRTLDMGLPCPPPAPDRELPRCDLLTLDQMLAVDDTAGLITLDELVLTPMQRKARADQLDAMRDGKLRRAPTVFGGLD